MPLFDSPELHAANPPSTWQVVRLCSTVWYVTPHGYKPGDSPLVGRKTKKEALAALTSGDAFNLYEKESRWYRGEPILGWRPYTECIGTPGPHRHRV